MFRPVSRSLFEPSAEVVASALLGHWLVRQTSEGPVGGPIVETEAYLVGDPACHSYVGETERNRVMWGPPGKAYVYLIYGAHYCVNAVCCPSGTAEAVLIRGVEAASGLTFMERRRRTEKIVELTNGPGKLCAALAIDRRLDGADLCDPSSPLIIAQDPDPAGTLAKLGPIVTTTRIGISKAADLPLRFYLSQSPFVSRKLGGTRSGKRS